MSASWKQSVVKYIQKLHLIAAISRQFNPGQGGSMVTYIGLETPLNSQSVDAYLWSMWQIEHQQGNLGGNQGGNQGRDRDHLPANHDSGGTYHQLWYSTIVGIQ